MPDEPRQESPTPIRPQQQQPKPQQQKQHKQQQRGGSDDDVFDAIEAIRKTLMQLQASAEVQDDVITELSKAVFESMEAQGTRQKAVLNAIQSQQEAVVAALETTQQMHRKMVTKLNERPVSRTWTPQRIVILTAAVTVVALLALVWHG